MDIDALRKMLKEDRENGLIPFWYGASYGTTNTCAYDQVNEIADICIENGMSLNLDAAYGIAFDFSNAHSKLALVG